MKRLSALERRAKILVQFGCVTTVEPGKRWTVKSQTDPDVTYDVMHNDGWHCTCPFSMHRNVFCKHIVAVQMSEGGTVKVKYNKPVLPPTYRKTS